MACNRAAAGAIPVSYTHLGVYKRQVSGEDFDSEFEIQVCERLQVLGYDVKRQILSLIHI